VPTGVPAYRGCVSCPRNTQVTPDALHSDTCLKLCPVANERANKHRCGGTTGQIQPLLKMLSKTLLRMMFLCTVAINTAHAANPACISAESDPDGDGWGWENDRSCIASTNSVEPEQNLSIGNGSGLPACQLSTSDPDGDGYGWENDSSCRVSGSTAAPAAETSGSSAAKPVCANAGSDPDGDGYGWENDRSCIVNGDSAITATTASSSGYSTPAETDQPDTDSASPLRFMAVSCLRTRVITGTAQTTF